MKKSAIAVVGAEVLIIGVLVFAIIFPFILMPGHDSDLSISMNISGGMSLASYQYNIDGTGNVSYEGRGFGGSTKRTAKITPQQLGELVAAVNTAHLWALKDEYRSMMICMDCPTADLYVTFNGWSKHISYYYGVCGGKFYPPPALCALQHKIEALGQLALPTHTPAPPPTPTPVPIAFLKFGDFGIVSQKPCGPPCFQGIRPGVTSFDDAATILKNAGVPCEDPIVPKGQDQNCNSGNTSISLGTVGMCTAGSTAPKVAGIDLRPLVKITVGDFIARYGPPDSVVIGNSAAMLAYESLQSIVSLQVGQPTYTISPDTMITEVDYVTTADYPKCVDMMQHEQQPWKGYGTYMPNVKP